MSRLLEVDGLDVHYGAVKAVDGLSFGVDRGRTLGLVGESGCGKSTTGYAILQLVRPSAGRVLFDGADLCRLDTASLRRLRRKLQIIFQDAHASLNPRLPVGDLVGEALDIHGLFPGAARAGRIRELLDLVGLAGHLIERYPHELSGGQAQRVAICRALAVEPELIVCDEPVSALDVSIQAQIVNLLQDLQQRLGLAYIFISHDLSVVRHMSDEVAVMYLGKIVELAGKERIYAAPAHPYTRSLLSAVPVPDPDLEAKRQRIILKGDLPDPAHPPSGCRFRTRCPIAIERCAAGDPPPQPLAAGHWAKCIRLSEGS
ncbi:MAG: ATP-binding cassette domain-containing protein [Alphaproteobacteria bacterium]|nr:ATP-binding cassette domain-containing protein [Alphaproteobacteria bacterium]